VGGGAEGVAENVGEHGGSRTVGADAGEAGLLVDRQEMVVVPGLAGAVEQVASEGLDEPGVTAEHRVQVGGHDGGRRPPVAGVQAGQADLGPQGVGG
jgi:hypothetical protein